MRFYKNGSETVFTIFYPFIIIGKKKLIPCCAVIKNDYLFLITTLFSVLLIFYAYTHTAILISHCTPL